MWNNIGTVPLNILMYWIKCDIINYDIRNKAILSCRMQLRNVAFSTAVMT